MRCPDLVRKHTRILEEKGLLAPRPAPDTRPATLRQCEVCGKELPRHLARVCSGKCYEKLPE